MDERIDRTETYREAPPVSRPGRVRPRSRLAWLILAVVAVGIGALVFRAMHPAPQPGPRGGRGAPGAAAQPVGAATADTGDIRVILNELGTVTPLATVTVKTQINGRLTAIVPEGQLVKAGDFLAQIDDRPYQAMLAKDQGQLAHDQALLEQAEADLKRFITLGRQDSIAKQQLEDQHFLVEQDEGTVKVDQSVIQTDQLNVDYAHILAPVAGRVGLHQVDVGNYVQTSDAGILVLTQLDPISVIFSVPQDNLPEITERLGSGAVLPVDAYDRTNTTLLASGKVETIDNQIDTTTGTVRIRATFPNPKNELFPNQFVNARLLVDTLHNVIRVPVAAIQQGAPGPFVYVINANDTVSVRQVALGQTDGKLVQVTSGLSSGERVVTDGTDRLRDGAKVAVPAAKAAAAGAGSQPGSASPAPTPTSPSGSQPAGQQRQHHRQHQ